MSAQVEGSGMFKTVASTPLVPTTRSRSNPVAPQLQTLDKLAEQATPLSDTPVKPPPSGLNAMRSKVSPPMSRNPSISSSASSPSSVAPRVTVSAPYSPNASPASSK